MLLNQSNAIGLAKASCTLCHGVGVRVIRKDTEVYCNCTFRAIFRACLNRFRHCACSADHIGSISLEVPRILEGRRSYGRKREEYVADFCLIAKRSLTRSDYTIFKYHILLGADWKMCCRRLNMDRGLFFHNLYRIEQRMGRIFCELKPYGLYPVNEYFGAVVLRKPIARAYVPERKSFRPPMAA